MSIFDSNIPFWIYSIFSLLCLSAFSFPIHLSSSISDYTTNIFPQASLMAKFQSTSFNVCCVHLLLLTIQPKLIQNSRNYSFVLCHSHSLSLFSNQTYSPYIIPSIFHFYFNRPNYLRTLISKILSNLIFSSECIFVISHKNDVLLGKNASIISLVLFTHKEKATIGIGIGWAG
jgi:hypothetical protein